MTKWKMTLILLCLVTLISPWVESAESNIYQEAIPHLKACISLISERKDLPTTTTPVDLREVCPTLANFLTYEPISEIDPPLENQTNRQYLESLVAILEAAKQGNKANLSGKFVTPGLQKIQYRAEPAQKPFFLAMAQWTFFHLQTFINSHANLTQPRLLHAIYIVVVNLLIILGLSALILYLVTSLRSSQSYLKHFKLKWQHQSRLMETKPSLDGIVRLNLNLQIPALIQLIKQQLQEAGAISDSNNISNAQLLKIVTQTKPQHAREIAGLIRLYDRLSYSMKTVAADEINYALEQARLILTEEAGT